jgi:hypothetical protein
LLDKEQLKSLNHQIIKLQLSWSDYGIGDQEIETTERSGRSCPFFHKLQLKDGKINGMPPTKIKCVQKYCQA